MAAHINNLYAYRIYVSLTVMRSHMYKKKNLNIYNKLAIYDETGL